MDSGDVEFSGGAVDFKPNESPNKDSGGPVDSMPAAKVAAEDVHFHASDIAKSDNNDFFDNPKKRKQREKEEQRRIRAEAKRVAKESRGRTRKNGASKDVVESEKALKREQSRIESEQRQARLRRFFGTIAKRWYIFATVAAVAAVVVLGVIFTPRIIKGIVDAKDDKYVSENKTLLMGLFEELAGKEMSREQLDEIVSKYDGKVVTEYGEYGGKIHPDNYWLESITMSFDAVDGQTCYGFIYKDENVLDGAAIFKRGDAFIFNGEDREQKFETVGEAVKAYLLSVRESRK